MEIRTLKAFVMLADGETYHAVAEEFHMSQSALSKAIMRLEEELGVKLFVREHRRVTLTKAGHCTYFSAREILESYESLQSQLLALTANKRIYGQILASESCFEIDEIIRQFSLQHPDIYISIEKADTYQAALNLLKSGEIDFLIAHDIMNPMDALIKCEILMPDTLLAAVHSKHRLAGCKALQISQLRYETIYVNRYSCSIVDEILKRHKLDPVRIVNIQNRGRMALLEYVIHGQGVTILFESDLKHKSLEKLSIAKIEDVDPMPLVYLTLANQNKGEPREIFGDFFVHFRR